MMHEEHPNDDQDNVVDEYERRQELEHLLLERCGNCDRWEQGTNPEWGSCPVVGKTHHSKCCPAHEYAWARAGGDCLCHTCGKPYRKHEPARRTSLLDSRGEPFLTLLCDGRLVKL